MSKINTKGLQQAKEGNKYAGSHKDYNEDPNNEPIVESVEPNVQELLDNNCALDHADIMLQKQSNKQTHKLYADKSKIKPRQINQKTLEKETLKLTTDGKAESIQTPTSNFAQSSDWINSFKKEPIHIDNDKILPISSLSLSHYKGIIKARVTNKSDIRTWSNSLGEGKVFHMYLYDGSGEIQAFAFMKGLANKFYNLVKVDKVYYISKFLLENANKQYSIVKNKYEIILNQKTTVIPCSDKIRVPKGICNIVPIDKISEHDCDSVIDVIGVCKNSSQVETFTSRKTNRELKKRDVTLVDQTRSSITLTLWDTDAENFDPSSQPVVAIRAAKVGEFHGGKNLYLMSSSVMILNPDISKARRLKRWFVNNGKYEEIVSLSARTRAVEWMSFKEVKDNCLGSTESGDYYQLKVTILLINENNAMYKACPTDDCNKKVIDLENGMYRCEKCNREYPNFKYRLVVSMKVADWCDSQRVSVFTSVAEKILGVTSEVLGIATEGNRKTLHDTCQQANFREFIFKCRAKMETYNGETQLKNVVVKADPINFKDYNSLLITKIREVMG